MTEERASLEVTCPKCGERSRIRIAAREKEDLPGYQMD